MNAMDFSRELVMAYRRAREPLKPHSRLARGENRSVASETEDLLAYFLAEKIEGINKIRINQPLTLPTTDPAKKRTIKPDLVFITKTEGKERIKLLLDLKMDLGYKRKKICTDIERAHMLCEEIRSKAARYRPEKQETKKTQIAIDFDSKLEYGFVVISDQNISKDDLNNAHKRSNAFKNAPLFILISGLHPNSYSIESEELIQDCALRLEKSLKELVDFVKQKI